MSKSSIPSLLSPEQTDIFTQLIRDNPISFQNEISDIKRNFPNLADVSAFSESDISSFSSSDLFKFQSRSEMYKKASGSEVNQISSTTGFTVLAADPNSDRFFERTDTAMKNFFKVSSKVDNFNLDLSTELGKLTKMVGNFSQTFIGKISDSLQEGLVGFIQGGMASQASKIFASKVPGALGKVVDFQTAMIGPTNKLFSGMECLSSKVSQAMSGTISDLLTAMTKNMLNAPTCATQQFVGALTNKIADMMDKVVTPLLAPIQSILSPIGAVFNVKDKIMGGIDFMKKVGNLFVCELPAKQTSSFKYSIDGLLKKDLSSGEHKSLVDDSISAAATTNSFLEKAADGLSSFEKAYGKWSIFGSPVDSGGAHESVFTGGNCDTGNNFACGPTSVDFFGGNGGDGATGNVILGNFLTRLDKDDIYGSFKKTASIIGVEITDPGSGYTSPPLVSFGDNCNQGYGAYGRAVIDTNQNSPTYGQLTDIIITSPGTNYPTDGYSIIDEDNPDSVNIIDSDNSEVYVDRVIIENGGSNYDPEEDDLENDDMSLIVNDDINSPNYGSIIGVDIIQQIGYDDVPRLDIKSKTGVNAILRPVMKVRQRVGAPTGATGVASEQVLQSVQCVGNFPRTN